MKNEIGINASMLSMWGPISELAKQRVDDVVLSQLLGISLIAFWIIKLLLSLFQTRIYRNRAVQNQDINKYQLFFQQSQLLDNRLAQIPCGILREVFGAVAGLLLGYYVIGKAVFYPCIILLVEFALLLFNANYLPLASFASAFSYFGFFRFAYLYGFPVLSSPAYFAHLMFAWRIFGLSIEVQSLRKEEKYRMKRSSLTKEPSLLQIILYCYNLLGLFTGPYYTYNSYRNAMNGNQSDLDAPLWNHFKWQMKSFVKASPSFLLLVYVIPMDQFRPSEFYDETVFFKLYVTILVFIWLRSRIYCIWMVAESFLALSCIGQTSEMDVFWKHGRLLLRQWMPKLDANFASFRHKKTIIDPTSTFLTSVFSQNEKRFILNKLSSLLLYVYCLFLTAPLFLCWLSKCAIYRILAPFVALHIFNDRLNSCSSAISYQKQSKFFIVVNYLIKHLAFTYLASGILLLKCEDIMRYCESLQAFVHFILSIAVFAVWFHKALNESSNMYRDTVHVQQEKDL